MKNLTPDNRDILVKGRQQAAVCRAQGFPETAEFLTALCDEIDRCRRLLSVVGAADATVAAVADRVNGHG